MTKPKHRQIKKLKAKPSDTMKAAYLEDIVKKYEQVFRQIKVVYSNSELHQVINNALKHDFDKVFYEFEKDEIIDYIKNNKNIKLEETKND